MKMLKEQYKRNIVLQNMTSTDCKITDTFYHHCKKDFVKVVLHLISTEEGPSLKMELIKEKPHIVCYWYFDYFFYTVIKSDYDMLSKNSNAILLLLIMHMYHDRLNKKITLYKKHWFQLCDYITGKRHWKM